MGHHAVDFPWSSFRRALLFGVPALAIGVMVATLVFTASYDHEVLVFNGREVPVGLTFDSVVILAVLATPFGATGVWLCRRLWIDIAEWRKRRRPSIDFSLR